MHPAGFGIWVLVIWVGLREGADTQEDSTPCLRGQLSRRKKKGGEKEDYYQKKLFGNGVNGDLKRGLRQLVGEQVYQKRP